MELVFRGKATSWAGSSPSRQCSISGRVECLLHCLVLHVACTKELKVQTLGFAAFFGKFLDRCVNWLYMCGSEGWVLCGPLPCFMLRYRFGRPYFYTPVPGSCGENQRAQFSVRLVLTWKRRAFAPLFGKLTCGPQEQDLCVPLRRDFCRAHLGDLCAACVLFFWSFLLAVYS